MMFNMRQGKETTEMDNPQQIGGTEQLFLLAVLAQYPMGISADGLNSRLSEANNIHDSIGKFIAGSNGILGLKIMTCVANLLKISN
jgi:hypothetical protein